MINQFKPVGKEDQRLNNIDNRLFNAKAQLYKYSFSEDDVFLPIHLPYQILRDDMTFRIIENSLKRTLK